LNVFEIPHQQVLLQRAFANKINILIAEDRPDQLLLYSVLFDSPLFCIQTCDSFTNFTQIVSKKALIPWHCWICDIDLGSDKTALDLLHIYRFPYIILISALQSMEIASQALQLGGIAVFDKNPDSIDRMYDKVCSLVALTFLLNGKPTDYLSQFLILTENVVVSKEQWCTLSCLGLRQLENICKLYSGLSPKKFLMAYHVLYLLLVQEQSQLCSQRLRNYLSEPDLVAQAINYVIKKLDYYTTFFSLRK